MLKKLIILLTLAGLTGACGKNGEPNPEVKDPYTGVGLGKVVVADSNGDTIGVITSAGLDTHIYVLSLKGYMFRLDKTTGKISNYTTDDPSVFYKHGATAIAGGRELDGTLHNASDCSDSDVSPSDVLFIIKNSFDLKIVFEANNQPYTLDPNSYNNPISFTYSKTNGSCIPASYNTSNPARYLVKAIQTNTTDTGVKVSYSLPLRFFYNNQEIKGF